MSDETAAEEKPGAVAPWATRRALAAVCAVLLVAVLALAGLAARQSARLQDERAERREVTRVAARLGSALLTYDYRDLEPTRRAVLAIATGSFEREYEEAFGGLQELYRTLQTTSRVVDVEVFVSDIDDGRASAVLALVAQAEGLAGPRAQRSLVRIELVDVEGRGWLVDGVTSLDAGRPVGAPADPAAPEAPAAPAE